MEKKKGKESLRFLVLGKSRVFCENPITLCREMTKLRIDTS